MNGYFTEKNILLFHEYLAQAKKCAVIGHVNPDGDAMGASLGLRQYIADKYPQIKVKVILPNRFPAYFGWMNGADNILIFNDQYTDAASKEQAANSKQRITEYLQGCDLIICVDFNSLTRLDELGKIVAPLAVRKILIDHHPQPSPDFDLLFSDPDACSTCEVLCRIIKTDDSTWSAAIAESLYTGIFTDTGGFAYNIKRPEVFRIAADLLETGIDRDAISARIFDNFSTHRMRLMGYALKDKMQVLDDRQAAYIALSQQELTDYHFETGDTEGFANIPLSIRGIVLSGFFYENSDKSHIRVSLRSKGDAISVNDIAREHFNGGGHFNAAGGKFFGTLTECCKFFENIVQKIVISAIFFCVMAQCSAPEIKPYKPEVSMEKQHLQQANAYWSRREYDQIEAYIRRQGLTMTASPGGFYLQITKNGQGQQIKRGSVVLLDAQIFLLDGTLCYHYDADNLLQVIVGQEALILGLHSALLGLRQGTEALLLLSSHLGFGLLGDRKCVPPQSPLICIVKIEDVE